MKTKTENFSERIYELLPLNKSKITISLNIYLNS